MSAREAYIMMATMLMATCRQVNAVVVHATVDLGGEQIELLQMLFKQMDTMISKEQEDSKTILQGDSQLASSLLQVVPAVTIKGNITDPERRLTLTFTVHASRSHYGAAAAAAVVDDDSDDDEEDDDWRCCSSSGVLTPIVDVVEPYFLGFVELVVNGILSTVISNFLEGSNLLGDVRLV